MKPFQRFLVIRFMMSVSTVFSDSIYDVG